MLIPLRISIINVFLFYYCYQVIVIISYSMLTINCIYLQDDRMMAF